MRTKRLLIFGGGICALAAITGCQSSNQTAGIEMSSETHLAANETGDRDAGSASPIESYKRKVVRDAMAGLEYATGRVEVDAQYAQHLDGVGDLDAAMEQYDKGQYEIRNYNNFIGAIRAFSNAVIMRPDQPEFYAGLGQALWLKDEIREAEAAYRTALDLAPERVEWRDMLATILYSRGAYAEAIDEWNQVLSRDPDNAEAHGRLATALYYEGDYTGAWDHLHWAEALGYEIPPQFRTLLAQHASDPGR